MTEMPKPARAADDGDSEDTVRIEAVVPRRAAVKAEGKVPLWHRRWAWLALLGLAFLVVIAMVVLTTQSAAHPPAVPRVTPQENTVALGSPMVVGKLVVAVTKVEVKDGLVKVEVLTKNTGTKKVDLSKTNVVIVTPDEKVQPLDTNATAKLGGDARTFTTLAPGQNVSGTLVFSSGVYKLPVGMVLRLSNPDLFAGHAFFALWA